MRRCDKCVVCTSSSWGVCVCVLCMCYQEIPPYAAEGEGGEVNLQDQTRSPAALLDQVWCV